MLLMFISKVHSKLGLDRCTHGLYSGAAPLSHDTMAFMKSLGLVISEVGYCQRHCLCQRHCSCSCHCHDYVCMACSRITNKRQTFPTCRSMEWRRTQTTTPTTSTQCKAMETGCQSWPWSSPPWPDRCPTSWWSPSPPSHHRNAHVQVHPTPRIQQGSVGRSAPGCQTKLHLQDPADGVGEVLNHHIENDHNWLLTFRIII